MSRDVCTVVSCGSMTYALGCEHRTLQVGLWVWGCCGQLFVAPLMEPSVEHLSLGLPLQGTVSLLPVSGVAMRLALANGSTCT